jgi:hypothetical protein
VTPKQQYKFPTGEAPDYWNPNPEDPEHRFALGRVLTPSVSLNPLLVIGMNPSYADHSESDRTVNTVIAASSRLGHDGWLMLNLYPERQTKPSDLSAFDAGLWATNLAVIEEVLDTFKATEVMGAWGNAPNPTIREALKRTSIALQARGTRVYYFGALTTSNSPRHPAPRGAIWDISGPKRYLI